jgi:hypothetical protein
MARQHVDTSDQYMGQWDFEYYDITAMRKIQTVVSSSLKKKFKNKHYRLLIKITIVNAILRLSNL